ncbi:oxidoreductase, FAD-binding [Cyanobium sp. PCC 7001]|uniref:FAD-dependent oxidoreductase n=1 Tax=Cyanobium sp. PCC 7001 TaxID=180281 RepID=UPI0001804F03|nr:FAD-dependent oxidoreductase [Cyanobium sp. PCC 7001]EDY37386.1 oxidoreductase, FAD-binding [Cyanobium sp. PCC 7001]
MPTDRRTGPWDVVVVGGGLAGGLLALELAERFSSVLVLDAGDSSATALSYGVMALPAALPWLALQLRHGALGLRWRWARLASVPGGGRGLEPLLERLPLPVAQVEAPAFLAALPAALAAAGVERLQARAGRLESLPRPDGSPGWALALEEDTVLEARQVVLAAGSGCRSLWPELDPRLRTSWAGVLELDRPPPPSVRWPAELVVPRRFQRLELERRAAQLTEPAWVVDAGVVSTGGRWLAGQISRVDPLSGPPDPERMEGWLRRGLAGLERHLGAAAGRYLQVPVPFCTDAVPLVGAVPGADGLWVFTGFTAAFSQVPGKARALARAIPQ